MTMKSFIVPAFLIFAFVAIISGCNSKDDFAGGYRVPALPAEVYDYDSLGFQPEFDPFDGLVIDDHKATLGRVLFYETRLSLNNRVSCGSCHLQSRAFSDHVAVSEGFHDGKTTRNTPPIVNVGLQERFFWDLRESELGNMVLRPIAHPVEMGLGSQDFMVEKIKSTSYYPPLFANAFGSEEVTVQRISDALETFIRSIVSVNTAFDRGRFNGFAEYTEEEELGRQLFFHKFPCSACHGGSELSGLSEAGNVGLDVHYADRGVIGVNPVTNQELNGWFKVPSLRNVEFTGPYMHDGRFNTLEEVINFYNSGVQPHPQLSVMLREHTDGGFFSLGTELGSHVAVSPLGRQPLRMHMSEPEKKALIAFMKTLSDHDFIRDPRFSDPFIIAD